MRLCVCVSFECSHARHKFYWQRVSRTHTLPNTNRLDIYMFVLTKITTEFDANEFLLSKLARVRSNFLFFFSLFPDPPHSHSLKMFATQIVFFFAQMNFVWQIIWQTSESHRSRVQFKIVCLKLNHVKCDFVYKYKSDDPRPQCTAANAVLNKTE